MGVLTNVEWQVYEQEKDAVRTSIADRISKEDLIGQLRNGFFSRPECKVNQEVILSYEEDGISRYVTVANKTSDVDEEHFDYGTSSPVFLASIEDNVDYSWDYVNACVKKADEGVELTQEQYVEGLKKGRK